MRISYLIAGLLSVALSLTVAAQTAATTRQDSPAAAQGTPAQQGAPSSETASPAAPSQAAPGQTSTTPGQTSTTPGTTPSTSQPQSQTDAENPLNLTEEQKTKLRPILTDERQQMEAVRNDTSLTPEQKMAKAQQIRETASPKIKAVLTPEQLKKLADMQKAQQQQSAPATGTPPPQQ